jgi:hypothetical protein
MLEDALFQNVLYGNQRCGYGMFFPGPGSEFFHPGSRVKKDSGSASKNLSIFNTENCF